MSGPASVLLRERRSPGRQVAAPRHRRRHRRRTRLSRPASARHRRRTRVRPLSTLPALYRSYDVAPLRTVAVAFGVLAVVRIAGAYSFPLMVASLSLTPLVLLLVPRRRWAAVGLCRPATWRVMYLTTGVVVLAYAATALACRAAFGTGADNWTWWVPELFRSLAPGHPALWVPAMVLSLGLLVPLLEEVCYRGVLHDALARRVGARGAVLVTAAGWAGVHLGDYGLVPYNGVVIAGVLPSVFLMGLALGYCRVRTGSVYASAGAQGVANLLLAGWALAL